MMEDLFPLDDDNGMMHGLALVMVFLGANDAALPTRTQHGQYHPP